MGDWQGRQVCRGSSLVTTFQIWPHSSSSKGQSSWQPPGPLPLRECLWQREEWAASPLLWAARLPHSHPAAPAHQVRPPRHPHQLHTECEPGGFAEEMLSALRQWSALPSSLLSPMSRVVLSIEHPRRRQPVCACFRQLLWRTGVRCDWESQLANKDGASSDCTTAKGSEMGSKGLNYIDVEGRRGRPACYRSFPSCRILHGLQECFFRARGAAGTAGQKQAFLQKRVVGGSRHSKASFRRTATGSHLGSPFCLSGAYSRCLCSSEWDEELHHFPIQATSPVTGKAAKKKQKPATFFGCKRGMVWESGMKSQPPTSLICGIASRQSLFRVFSCKML